MKAQHYKPVIVLDVGKVLVNFNPKVVLEELSKRYAREIDIPRSLNLDELFFPVYVGRQSWEDILPVLNSTLGFLLEPQEWRELWCSIFTGEVPRMREALAELKSEFRLVALSNTEEVHWTFVLRKYPIFKLLDGWVASYAVGVAKPDPTIYGAVGDRYCDGRLPAFYTDDTPQFVEAARRLGWNAEVFIDAAHFKEDIRRLRRDSIKGPA